jgi:hypothetical protein
MHVSFDTYGEALTLDTWNKSCSLLALTPIGHTSGEPEGTHDLVSNQRRASIVELSLQLGEQETLGFPKSSVTGRLNAV